VLRDWSTGKFPRYTTPQVSSSTTIVSDTQLASIYAKDGSILSSLKSRKEMRTSGGLLKFTSGEVESRTVAIEEPWKCEDGDESSDDDVENEWEDVDEKEGQAILPPSPDERKRKRVTEGPLPSSKKVTFAPRPEASKQARVDASRKIREKPTTRALGKMKLVGPGTQPVTKQPKEMGKKKPGKVANVAAKPKLGKTDDAYDFSKFF
jgi:nuclear GTP-binding protein